MKYFYTFIIILALASSGFAQNLILNGSFENNSATGNTPNLNANWSSYVSDSWHIDGGRMNLDTSYSCGTASQGHWFVTNCPGCPPSNYASFSFRLSRQLVPFDTCVISFDKQYCGDSTAIEIGLSDDSSMTGTNIHTFPGPTSGSWEHESYSFVSPVFANFLTVAVNIVNVTSGLIAVDNFRLTPGPCAAYYLVTPDATPHSWTVLDQAFGALPISYVWNWGDGDSSTTATPSHLYSNAGNHNICLSITDVNGCRSSYCDSSIYLYRTSATAVPVSVHVVNTITAIPAINTENNKFSVYPNPSGGNIQVRAASECRDARVELLNALGEIILTDHISNSSSKEINLSNISSGIYFIKLSDESNQSISRLVIQKE